MKASPGSLPSAAFPFLLFSDVLEYSSTSEERRGQERVIGAKGEEEMEQRNLLSWAVLKAEPSSTLPQTHAPTFLSAEITRWQKEEFLKDEAAPMLVSPPNPIEMHSTMHHHPPTHRQFELGKSPQFYHLFCCLCEPGFRFSAKEAI